MYVTQIPATVIYTLLKTLLLIMAGKTIESACSWKKRYDLAKIFQGGSYPVIYSVCRYRGYQKYWTVGTSAILFLILAIETVINLLPTIATGTMPFESISFTRGDSKYFPAIYNTPTQPVRIPSQAYDTPAVDSMQNFCEGMSLCTDLKYDTNVLAISPTLQSTKVPYDYQTQKFITEFVNVSTPYCLPGVNESCLESSALFSASNSNHTVISPPGLPSGIVTYHVQVDQSDYGAETISDATKLYLEYKVSGGDTITEAIDTSAISAMLYRPSKTDIISTTHLSKVLFTNRRSTILLVLKVALHNISANGPSEESVPSGSEDSIPILSTVFNNTAILSNSSATYNGAYYNLSIGDLPATTAYTSYTTDGYLSVDLLQRTSYYGADTILKLRVLLGLYVIVDPALDPVDEPKYSSNRYLTNYNQSRNEHSDMSPTRFKMRESNFSDEMFDQFNDPPANDIFMYAVLDSSGHIMYGKEGYKDIVADVSPAFLGTLLAILFVTLLIYGVSAHLRDPLYFSTLYQAVGRIDSSGCVNNLNDVIPRLSISDGRICSGEKVVTWKGNLELLGQRQEDEHT